MDVIKKKYPTVALVVLAGIIFLIIKLAIGIFGGPSEEEIAKNREVLGFGGSVLSTVQISMIDHTTSEDIANHVSVDIYGDVGVKRAAAYPFVKVDEDYFKDAVFIGDSRMVGVKNFSGLGDIADFYADTSLNIYSIMDHNYPGMGYIRDGVKDSKYKKIYISSGINEMGTGTTETNTAQYKKVVNELREMNPDSIIFIMGTMKVTKSKSDAGGVFRNSNIEARNRAIATLADNKHVFYIDPNEVLCDKDGNMKAEYTADSIHLTAEHNKKIKEFLMTKGVVKKEEKKDKDKKN